MWKSIVWDIVKEWRSKERVLERAGLEVVEEGRRKKRGEEH